MKKKKLRKNSWSQCRKESSKWRRTCGKKVENTQSRGNRKEGDQTLQTQKIWQMEQSSNTKVENLEHDFNEIVASVQELGWRDGKRHTRSWVEKEEESS